MSSTIQVIPAVIPGDFTALRADLARVKDNVSRVQIDIIDGRFAPEPTWPFANDGGEFDAIVSQEEGMPYWEDVLFEIDMMVYRPEDYVDEWIRAGVSALIIHHGSTEAFTEIRQKASKFDVACGVAIRPSTPLDVIDDYLPHVSFIQVMGNDKIGFHGVVLDERVYEIVQKLRERVSDMDIAVDIGVNEETAPKLRDAGATKLISGSAIFESENIEETIQMLQGES